MEYERVTESYIEISFSGEDDPNKPPDTPEKTWEVFYITPGIRKLVSTELRPVVQKKTSPIIKFIYNKLGIKLP